MKRIFLMAMLALILPSPAVGQTAGVVRATESTPSIDISPSPALVDDEVKVQLSGFAPHQRVAVRARMKDDSKRAWQSEAVFLADEHGLVKLDSQKPLSGTYPEADPSGLFWSMTPAPDEKQLSPFNKQTLEPIVVTFTAEVEGRQLASATLELLSIAPGVRRRVVQEQGLAGALFLPAGGGSHPGIIVVGGSGGGLREQQAALFASRGYAALALAYFHFQQLPAGLVNIPLEYFETAIRWMQSQSEVKADRLAFVGTSRGAELALLAGATFPQIKAVVAYAPSSVVWGGVTETPGDVAKPSWTYRGAPLPFIARAVPPAEIAEEPAQESISFTPSFLARLSDPDMVQRAAIPVERIKGPVLLISGQDDKMWPSSMMSAMVVKRLTEHGHPYPFKHLSYQGVGHFGVTPFPNLPKTIQSSRHPVRGYVVELGGNAKDTAYAASDSWHQVLSFLQESLEGPQADALGEKAIPFRSGRASAERPAMKSPGYEQRPMNGA
jgi:dienelactone hydrolase